jgi:putative transposase
MNCTVERPRRKSIRLPCYDYSQPGAYFITICTHQRRCCMARVVDNRVIPSLLGEIVENQWTNLPRHYPHIEIEAFVLMPNHVHGVIVIVGAGWEPAPTGSDAKPDHPRGGDTALEGLEPAPTESVAKQHGVPEIVRGFKTFSARRINEMRRTPGAQFWQRSYYEHIIRNEQELGRITEYIESNPLNWQLDRENPKSQNFNVRQSEYWARVCER